MAAQASRVTQAAPGATIGTPTVEPKIRQIRETGRVNRATIKARERHRQATTYVRGAVTQSTLREAGRIRRENIDYQTGAYGQRNVQRNVAAIERRRAYNQLQAKEQYKQALVRQPIINTAQPVARSGFVLLSVFALLIVFYLIITKPAGFTGWTVGLANFVGTFTQNGPLFTKNTGS